MDLLFSALLTLASLAAPVVEDNAMEMETQQMTMIRVATAVAAADLEEGIHAVMEDVAPATMEAMQMVVSTVVEAAVAAEVAVDTEVVAAPAVVATVVVAPAAMAAVVSPLDRMSTLVAAAEVEALVVEALEVVAAPAAVEATEKIRGLDY